jgi:hypothetical protein
MLIPLHRRPLLSWRFMSRKSKNRLVRHARVGKKDLVEQDICNRHRLSNSLIFCSPEISSFNIDCEHRTAAATSVRDLDELWLRQLSLDSILELLFGCRTLPDALSIESSRQTTDDISSTLSQHSRDSTREVTLLSGRPTKYDLEDCSKHCTSNDGFPRCKRLETEDLKPSETVLAGRLDVGSIDCVVPKAEGLLFFRNTPSVRQFQTWSRFSPSRVEAHGPRIPKVNVSAKHHHRVVSFCAWSGDYTASQLKRLWTCTCILHGWPGDVD